MPKEEKKEKVIDIKGTFEDFVGEEKPELSQEEAIKAYKEGKEESNKKTKKKEEEADEEDEDIRNLKKELLKSLERVNELAKKLFEEDKKNIRDSKDLKVKQKNKKKEKEQEKSREDVIEQMRKTMQGEKEKKERSREE